MSNPATKGVWKFPTARGKKKDQAFESTGGKPPYPTKDSRNYSNSSGKRQKGVKDDSSFRLDAYVNAVTKPKVSVALEPGTPSFSVSR
jgi:hypothetical protein